eukprot:g57943.t1
MRMPDKKREFDLCVWGATGFTGQLVVAALERRQDKFFSCQLPTHFPKVKYCVAGRNRAKLEAVLKDCGSQAPVFVAKAEDKEAIRRFVSACRVVVATAGPFQLYSDLVVQVCVEEGTHYVDTTGEACASVSLLEGRNTVLLP